MLTEEKLKVPRIIESKIWFWDTFSCVFPILILFLLTYEKVGNSEILISFEARDVSLA